MDFNNFLIALAKIKNIPLPGEASQFKMSPPFRSELIKVYNGAKLKAKRAGVLALFYPDNQQRTKLALILRKTYRGVHSAQIGFPGGRYEDKDKTLRQTAIRETFEEIGISMNLIEVIQRMTDIYIPPSNFYVQPFFAITKSTPIFKKQDSEVEAILEVAISELLDDRFVIQESVMSSNGNLVDVPAYVFNGHIVWGATAMMLSEIKDLTRQIL